MATDAVGNQYDKELSLEVLGLHGLNSFCMHNSSSRSVMFTGHLSQRLCLNEPGPKRIMSGLEQEMSKYTFDVRMPSDGRILKIIDRYPIGEDANSLKYNPETIVIYEDDATKVIDCIILPKYKKLHQHFGFDYKYRDTSSLIRKNAFIPKDTIFAAPKSVSENGDYMYGINAKAALMSVASIAEDGVAIREGFLEKLKFKVYDTRIVEFGLNSYPLNLYGDMDNYKPFPDIGEYIREDGTLVVLRDYDVDLSPVDMSIYDTKEIDYIFDKCLYARAGKGKVVDIKVYNNPGTIDKTPEMITDYLDRYVNAQQRFYKELVDTDIALRTESKKKYGSDRVKLGRTLHKLMTSAYVAIDPFKDKYKKPVSLMYKKKVLDQYRVELVIEYEVTPTIGFKLTCINGGKGVICKVIPDKDMPVDDLGRVADVILDPISVPNRTNLGRLYEFYINDVLEQTEMKLKQMVEFKSNMSFKEFNSIDPLAIYNTLEYLFKLIGILAPKQEEFLRSLSEDDKIEYLYEVLKSNITVHIPPNTDVDLPDTIINVIEQSGYKPYLNKVKYTGADGASCITDCDVRIADLYIMLLDKIADDWSSVSVSKLQHHGIISANKLVKHDYPYRCSPVRVQGEDENRILAGYTNSENVAELIDRNNNPLTMRAIVHNILASEKPTNIYRLIDRSRIPYGSNKPLQLINHIFSSCGFKPTYKKDV